MTNSKLAWNHRPWAPGLSLATVATAATGDAAVPPTTSWPAGLGLHGRTIGSPDRADWAPRVRRGLVPLRRVIVPTIALAASAAVLVTALAITTWLTQPRTPYGFYRSESPLQLSGLGPGQTETFALDGGDLSVAWYASTEWGCRLEMELIPANGGAPITLADAPVSGTATGTVDLAAIAPGEYALRAESGCLWTVTFGNALG